MVNLSCGFRQCNTRKQFRRHLRASSPIHPEIPSALIAFICPTTLLFCQMLLPDSVGYEPAPISTQVRALSSGHGLSVFDNRGRRRV